MKKTNELKKKILPQIFRLYEHYAAGRIFASLVINPGILQKRIKECYNATFDSNSTFVIGMSFIVIENSSQINLKDTDNFS